MVTVRKPVRPQAERRAQFTDPDHWGHYALSLDLTVCAETLLEAALRERGPERTYTTAGNHYSFRAIGATVLITTAFDAFLNEVCDFQSNQVAGSRVLAAETQSTVDKFAGLLRLSDPSAVFDTTELVLLTAVRNEIVHYLPRPTPTEGHVADVLAALHARGLLLVTPGPEDTWEIPQKIANYALAYWAFRSVEAAVIALCDATPQERHTSILLAENFDGYRRACPPERLAEYDAENGIDPLTYHQ
jgi:hypothetical protein